MEVVIIGAGYGGEVVADMLNNDKDYCYSVAGFLDDNKSLWGKKLNGIDIKGGIDKIEEYKNCYVIISITSNMELRRKIFSDLKKKGYRFINAIDRTASIKGKIGVNNIIGSFVKIGYGTVIGDSNLISSLTTIEHHNKIGNNVIFGPHCSTSGDVEIGDDCKFGMQIGVEPHVRIGKRCIISSGSIILNNIPDFTCVKSYIKECVRTL